MRLLFIILFIPTLAFGQVQSPKISIPEPVKVLTLYSAAIIFDAVGDGLYDSGEKTWGHTLQAASVATLLISPLVLDMNKDNWWWYIITYTSLRIAIFDYSYNLTRGLPLNYVGTTSITDKIQQKFNPPTGHLWFPKAIFLTLSITIPINEL